MIIDKAVRVVIPKPLREEFHLEAGDAWEMESGAEALMTSATGVSWAPASTTRCWCIARSNAEIIYT